MKKIFLTLVALVAIAALLPACAYKEAAEEEARKYADELGLPLANVVCVNQDSDGDGYFSCTFKMEDGSTEAWECVAPIGLAWDDGCRKPKVNMFRD